MKVRFSEAAATDLDSILAYTAANFPSSVEPLERRIRAAVARVARMPKSGREISERPGVRVVPLIRYPFRIYYQIRSDHVEILHIHHTSRELFTD